MAFKEVNSLDCEVTISLGGVNKKTNKANPTKIEGYYLGKREVEDTKKTSGKSYIYVFQTSKGSVGVWGKTDLDRKMAGASLGAMTRVTQNGMAPTKNGDMYKYKVEVDTENSVDVSAAPAEEASEGSDNFEELEESDLDAEEEALDEVLPARAAAPRAPAKAPDAARQARVQALLAGSRK